MTVLWQQIDLGLRLHFRNRMAVVYNYLFPTMFLLAFWALYRYERVPLQAHMGELLTVTLLGGACFGLPTTLVSERERGVWRRYRLMPVPTATVMASTLAARYVMLVLAAVLQVVLAMAIGLPWPDRPLDLWITFTCAAMAFMGIGLVIAMIAENVPAVQALGQSIFLPMLIIGGVAVPLARLPEWAQSLSSFLPGRYAVQAIQASVNGAGMPAAWFSVVALLVTGAAACLAAARMFRWDAQDRLALRGRKGWIAAAVIPWVAIGVVAESRPAAPAVDTASVSVAELTRREVIPAAPLPEPTPTDAERGLGAEATPVTPAAPVAVAPSTPDAPVPPAAGAIVPAPSASAPSSSSTPAPSTPSAPTPSPLPGPVSPEWASVTVAQIENDIVFDRLPPDAAVVTPLARPTDPVDSTAVDQLTVVERELDGWAPGTVADPAQRARNLLYVAGVIDLLQLPHEPYVPRLVFSKLQREIPRDDLVKILYFIAVRWASGDDSAIQEMGAFGIDAAPEDIDQVRNRASIYAVKLLGRLIGQIPD